ncbi:H-NS family nucleoid-associated regulatory protein [Rubrimonas cliftonensis]|uniref:DNA-binding protein H-NS n=1 Tax=Rubrimonas cliftonensis TaxID=89524 RepID=A0A1H4G010_9RHOB|nr:H-NS histone family protein [Rubrimonas cliftonensis]SEB02943.1 DNA-binding protein H-NS [Rubrimonas cliftonensis]
MIDVDLSALSLADLKKLETDVAKYIATFEERQKAEARAAAEAIAKKFGFALSDLIQGNAPKKKPTPEAKYRHPERPAVTWSGRGRKPGWISEGLAAGKTLEDFAI